MTKADHDSLVLALERGAASHGHTAGKARFYLSKLIDRPNARFSNCSQEEFISAVRQAVALGKWKELSDLMARWW